MERNCHNCALPIKKDYCPSCGQRYVSLPYTFSNTIKKWLIDTFDIDKGYFLTLYLLFVRPKFLIENYLKGKTKNYVNPIKFLIITIAAIALYNYIDQLIEPSELADNDLMAYFFWLAFALPLYVFNILFFAKSEFNFFEHFLIVLYESNAFIILMIPSTMISSFMYSGESNENLITVFMLLILTTFYHSYYSLNVFKGRKVLIVLKALFSVVVTFLILGFVASNVSHFLR